MFGDHGLGGLVKEGAHGKSPKCLGENLGDFGEFCKGLSLIDVIEKAPVIRVLFCFQTALEVICLH